MAPLRHRPKDAAADWHRRTGPLRVGAMIDDRYEVVELLSNGATADVCKVRHRVLGRQFALKVLRTECARDVEYSERLLREARALGALNHPNIVTITDCGRLPTGEPYFVMESVEGISLEDLMHLFEVAWRRNGFGHSADELQFREKAVSALARYWELDREREGEPVWFERGFAFKLGEHFVRGRVDRVDRLPDGSYELIDYKTGWAKTEQQLREDIQLSLYQMGAAIPPPRDASAR